MSVSATARLEHGTEYQRIPRTRGSRTLKRIMDVAVSATLLLLSAPVIAVLALRIKLHDGGPILFRRRVIGPKGEFDAFKLRTMRVDADEVLERDPALRREFEIHFKLKHDPRVTRVGAGLRRSGLDELPQLWNVLKGEMSLIGPRMITAAELEKFGAYDWIFNCMKPGLTGPWQLEGTHEGGYARRAAMDLWYLNNWSFLLDLKILIKTPMRVVRGPRVQ